MRFMPYRAINQSWVHAAGFSPGGPQAWGQEEEADTRAAATATKTLLSPEQLLLICEGGEAVSATRYPPR